MAFEGQIDVASSDFAREETLKLLESKPTVISMAKCPYVSSSGLRALLMIAKAAKSKGIKLVYAAAILLTSWGIPMILAGDEFGNSQFGNNNPYCQDNKISWLDWNDLQKNKDLYNFFKKMISFRKSHPVLMRMSQGTPYGYPMFSMHGINAWQFDKSPENRILGVMFAGKTFDGSDDFIYLGINTHWESHGVWLPQLPQNLTWQVEINTDLGDAAVYDSPAEIDSSNQFIIGARSVIVCTSKNLI